MTKETQVITFLLLPHDVLCNILSHCDVKTLGRLSCVCRQLNRLMSEECIWVNRSKKLLVTNQKAHSFRERSFQLLSSKEKYKVSLNWRKSKYKELGLISQHTKYMPWIQLEADKLWYSKGSNIFCYTRKPRGRLQHKPLLVLRGHVDDVCHFVCRDGIVYSGSRYGTVCGWHADNGKLLFRSHLSHFSDINSVDAWNNIIVSGSKDGTVKTWNVQKGLLVLRSTLQIRDRVWSLTVTPIDRYEHRDYLVFPPSPDIAVHAGRFATQLREGVAMPPHLSEEDALVYHRQDDIYLDIQRLDLWGA
ncbi:F-box/WD repeat-containing protein 4-like, partial [Limulus polyphemus]|uniref:F-box/WD repeat-containing protein 4-like n=1 Tax=Limulus polyphemus TaxID=6850 RepID=A0ABM1BEX4_LIMPO